MTSSETIHLLADVHSNLEALEVVLDDIPGEEGDSLICLGDIVGYGANPSECLQRLRERDAILVAGNHDAAACGEMSTEFFNRLAKRAAEWTHDQLSDSERQVLADLPEEHHQSGIACYHGSPRKPLVEYVTSEPMAADMLDLIEETKLAVGHTHRPIYYRKDRATTRGHAVRGNERLGTVTAEERMVVNPGSVGQPRDGDPRASYMTIEVGRNGSMDLEWKRLEYPVETAQNKIREAGLPETLATRLSRGQ